LALRYLLDTNIISELVRHPQGVIAMKVAQVGEESVCTSIIVAGELRFGAAKRGSERLSAQLDAVLFALEILPLEPPADHHYGLLRRHLEQQGTPIGPNDMLIAAHGLALDLTVVTHNVQEFSRVPDLKVESWV
jgi:tRNA(fMet)-specific endonuclease VapC